MQIEAKNNGHSYGVSFTGYTDSSSPKITYGGLPGVFKLVGLHFHWGSDDSQGSEHRVNNMAFPAEVGIGASYMNFSTVVEFKFILDFYREQSDIILFISSCILYISIRNIPALLKA